MTQQDAIIGHIRALIRDLEPRERREVIQRILADFLNREELRSMEEVAALIEEAREEEADAWSMDMLNER